MFDFDGSTFHFVRDSFQEIYIEVFVHKNEMGERKILK